MKGKVVRLATWAEKKRNRQLNPMELEEKLEKLVDVIDDLLGRIEQNERTIRKLVKILKENAEGKLPHRNRDSGS